MNCCLCGHHDTAHMKKVDKYWICMMCSVMCEKEIEDEKIDTSLEEYIVAKLTLKKLGNNEYYPKLEWGLAGE